MDEATSPDDATLAEGTPPPAAGAAMEVTLAAGSPDPDAPGSTIGADPSPMAPGRGLPKIPGYEVLGELGFGRDWYDRLITESALREAEALIQPAPPARPLTPARADRATAAS